MEQAERSSKIYIPFGESVLASPSGFRCEGHTNSWNATQAGRSRFFVNPTRILAKDPFYDAQTFGASTARMKITSRSVASNASAQTKKWSFCVECVSPVRSFFSQLWKKCVFMLWLRAAAVAAAAAAVSSIFDRCRENKMHFFRSFFLNIQLFIVTEFGYPK